MGLAVALIGHAVCCRFQSTEVVENAVHLGLCGSGGGSCLGVHTRSWQEAHWSEIGAWRCRLQAGVRWCRCARGSGQKGATSCTWYRSDIGQCRGLLRFEALVEDMGSHTNQGPKVVTRKAA